ncbi:queuine tRNA-ribosyltransferase accessory subunit 2-like [Ptychodera flava]|uniref:queuine tRNA-ribosyltransferase accessory subunit 2-like n=1 Tax=Ptychodera flava TaxID=63121 RepID=UPI00396A7C8A
MKLILRKTVSGGCRLGELVDVGLQGNYKMSIPCCLTYTRGAAAPHLTKDMMGTLPEVPFGIQLTLPTLAENQEILEDFKDGISKFSNLPESMLFLSVQDPGTSTPSGYNERQCASIWCPGGRMRLSPDNLITMVKCIQPDWFESLYDGDQTAIRSSRKRTVKSVDRTLNFLDAVLNAKQNSQELKDTQVFGVIEGGDISDERLRSVRETAKRPVSGFVLDGFHGDSVTSEVDKDLLLVTLAELPEDKPRIIHGSGRPDQVMQDIEAGIDIFDSAFPYVVTERGCALTFNFNHSDPEDLDNSQQTTCHEEFSQQSPTVTNNRQNGVNSLCKTDYEIDLNDQRYKEDMTSLVSGCQCYCCKNHTKAYIHHLLMTKELLARVLLMLHNFHHYFLFFQEIRDSLNEDRFQALKARIMLLR